MTVTSLEEIRCPSCLGILGISKRPDKIAVYCSDYCAEDYRVTANEERDSLIEFLAHQGRTATEIAADMDNEISRQAVAQILDRRYPG